TFEVTGYLAAQRAAAAALIQVLGNDSSHYVRAKALSRLPIMGVPNDLLVEAVQALAAATTDPALRAAARSMTPGFGCVNDPITALHGIFQSADASVEAKATALELMTYLVGAGQLDGEDALRIHDLIRDSMTPLEGARRAHMQPMNNYSYIPR